MLRELVLLSAIVAVIALGQTVGVGAHLIETYPPLKIDGIASVVGCALIIGMGIWIAKPTVAPVWNLLSPINRPTYWEHFAAGWSACGLGAFAILLHYTPLAVGDAAQTAALVLLARVPVVLAEYGLSFRDRANEASDPDVEPNARNSDARQLKASWTASLAGLSVLASPFLLVPLLLGPEALAAETIESGIRSCLMILLGAVALNPYLISVSEWFLGLLGKKLSADRGQFTIAYVSPLWIAFISIGILKVLTNTHPLLMLSVTMLALAGSWIAGTIYVRARYDFPGLKFASSTTFD